MAYQGAVLADAPALYWRCSEESGPAVADASGNTQTGTAQGGVTFAQAGLLRADASRALSLDGVLANDYQERVLADAPLAYWPLQETSGTVVSDASGTGCDGTVPPDGSIVLGAAGPHGARCARFVDSYGGAPGPGVGGPGIALANPSALPLDPGAMTVEFWANLSAPAGAVGSWFEAVLWWGAAAGGQPYWLVDMEVQDSAPAVFAPEIYEYGNGYLAPSASDPVAGWGPHTWHHVALTWDSANNPDGWAVYLDGALWNGSGVSLTPFDAQTGTIDAARLGATVGEAFTETLVGGLAHVALYDHALSPTRVLAHYVGLVAPSAGTMVVQDGTDTLPAAVSIECWLRTTTEQGGVLAQFATADGTQRDLTLYLRADGTPAFRAGDTEIVRSTGGDRTVADGRIHHVVATLDADAVAWLYVDGNQAAHHAGVTPASPFTGRWQIGAGTTLDLAVPPLSPAYAGTIDEVAIYQD